MFTKSYRSYSTLKVEVQQHKSQIKISGENEPGIMLEYTFVNSSLSDQGADTEFINIVGIEYRSNGKRLIKLECSNESTCFTLEQDLSNIVEIIGRFDKLAEVLFEIYKWEYLFLDTDCIFNLVKYYESNSERFVRLNIKSDFEDFNTLEKYDFIIEEKPDIALDGKITFDGETLLMGKYTVRFISKPTFGRFAIDLDDRINSISFEVPQGFYITEFMSYYKRENDKYDIYVRPTRVEQISYLRLLNNVGWFDNNVSNYTEQDVLTKVYNI